MPASPLRGIKCHQVPVHAHRTESVASADVAQIYRPVVTETLASKKAAEHNWSRLRFAVVIGRPQSWPRGRLQQQKYRMYNHLPGQPMEKPHESGP
jgi:hypothetical protein